ncbi:MAG: tRNA (adenine-N1)-methyltransferase, partial [Pseudarthrobacter sp.]
MSSESAADTAAPSTIGVAAGAQPVGAARRRGPFREGERVQLTDERGRMNTVTLERGGAFHTHRGFLNHDEIIGQADGSV